MLLVSKKGSSSLLEIYDYIGDCITGRSNEIIDWERKFIDKKQIKDAWNKFKRQLQYDRRAFACAKEFIEFEKAMGL